MAEARLVGARAGAARGRRRGCAPRQALLALELAASALLQPGLRRRVVELGVLGGERVVGEPIALDLLARRLDCALELLASRRERAQLELRLLRLALERTLLARAGVERAARGERRLVERRLPLLRDTELAVERLEARLAGARRSASSSSSASSSARSPPSCSRRWLVCSASCVRRSNSTCCWWPRDCAAPPRAGSSRGARRRRCSRPRRESGGCAPRR